MSETEEESDFLEFDSDEEVIPGKSKIASKTTTSSAKSKNKEKDVEGKTIEEMYQKKTQLEHILLRPDTYIGSVEATNANMWVVGNNKNMEVKQLTVVPGLYKIFDEILVNAADNKQRDPSMDTIKVNFSQETGQISVWNNGQGIPVQLHKKENVYVPELIFGHLLTSSNYNDNEKKVVGGRNGYGAKLCNIFSKEFKVETRSEGMVFQQTFTENMTQRTKPSITKKSGGDFTKISFIPDFEKFGLDKLDDDHIALFQKRVYDIAGCVRGVKVFLNDERIKIKDFKEYVDLYLEGVKASTGTKPPIVYERVSDRWEVAFTISDGQFQQVSFVNSICTTKGGTHVTHASEKMVSSLIEAVAKKDKKGAPLKPFQAKSHIWIFLNCLIENPAFDSQTKENMTLKVSSFGSKCTLSEDFLKKVVKSGVVENIVQFSKFKQEQALKKSDGQKRSRISGLVKLDDANNAGTRNGSLCTLILTEGDSAKALAVSGLGVVGRDNFGVFPLRGKMLNVREATHSQIMNNNEITAIKQIMGLQQGKVYTSINELRYGHLMIMTDQDHDGSHIKGLIINFLDHFWPSLLKIPNFLLEFITPIVKVSQGKDKRKKEISFFTIPEYEAWKKDNNEGKGWNIKYYKGLGTSSTEDAKKYFSDMDLHLKPFKAARDEDRELVDLAFNKKKADERKEWLRQFEPGTYMDHSMKQIPLSDFINKELILFSMADNARSIPSVVDGLKPGQRKILFSCFKRNLKNEIKVAQLAGYVAEHSAYHHGEQSLCSTVVGLAQNFVGSNNLTLLEPRGQFGTRLQGGKDAASARYIFTLLNKSARLMFNEADDNLLEYLNDDGQSIEPNWYMPILPMVLVNGSEGIGTGWSTFIPNYNPKDIAKNIMHLMNGEEMEEMVPWYRGFTGDIVPNGKDKFKCEGSIRKIDDTTVEITELPIRTWTQSYKEQLEAWVAGTDKQEAWIKDYKEYHTDSIVHFVVTLTEENMKKAEEEGLHKKFKLSSSIATTNMVCFDKENRIRKYESVEDIIKEFYDMRLEYYQKRKAFLLDQLTKEWKKLDNKVRFIMEIINGTLVVQNRKKADVVAQLKSKGYDAFPKVVKKGSEEEVEEEDAEEDVKGGYDYLLSMPIYNLTMEKVQQMMKERDDKNAELTVLMTKSPMNLWKGDLDNFLEYWDKYESEMADQEAQRPAKGVTSMNRKNAVKKAGVVRKKKVDSDDDSDVEMEVKKKPPPKKKVEPLSKPKSPPKKRAIKTINSDDEDGSDFGAEIELKASPKKKTKKVDSNGSDEEFAKPAAKKSPVKKAKKDDDDDDFAEEKVVKKRAPAKKSAPKVSDSDDEVEVVKPASKKRITKKKTTSDVEGEDSDKPAPKKRPVKKVVKKIEDDDEDDDFPTNQIKKREPKSDGSLSFNGEILDLKASLSQLKVGTSENKPKKATKTEIAKAAEPAKATKKPAPKKKQVIRLDSDISDAEMIDSPPPKPKAKKAAPVKKASKKVSDDDEDQMSDGENDEPIVVSKPVRTARKATKVATYDFGDLSDGGEESEFNMGSDSD